MVAVSIFLSLKKAKTGGEMYRAGSMVLLFVIFLLAGCASKISRYGYSLQDMPDKYRNFGCDILIKKDFAYNKDEAEILGEIKAGDSGFSFDCGEKYVLSLFKKEACALGADLINIVYERKGDLWSSCYRAKAQLLRFKDKEKPKNLQSDPAYIY